MRFGKSVIQGMRENHFQAWKSEGGMRKGTLEGEERALGVPNATEKSSKMKSENWPLELAVWRLMLLLLYAFMCAIEEEKKLSHNDLLRRLSFIERKSFWVSWLWINICKCVPGVLGSRIWGEPDPFHYEVKGICTGDLAGVAWKGRDEEEGWKSAGGWWEDDLRLRL